ncbi:MAG: thiamine ABC transporter substrate-binding protein [Corynebacterium sp.]|nr:thiamine ABC transporter substrate-binding protein [Corynebacterium sp.]
MNTGIALAATLTTAALLAGCGTDTTTGSADSTTAAAAGETTVTVLTHDSFDLPQELIDQFEAESGYTLVTTAPGDSAVVAGQLILTKDNPTVDAVFGIDTFTAAKATDAGVLADYTPAGLPESARDYIIDPALTPTDVGDVCVNIDHAYFTDNNLAEPATFEDLAKPEYAPLLVTENPASSSPGLAFLAATVAHFGEDGYLPYWKQVLDAGSKVDEGWSDAYYTDFSGADGKGAFPLVVSYSSSLAETGGATGYLPQTCVRQVEYAGVVAGAKNPEGAKAFVDFMVSPQVQAAFPEAMYMYPIDSTTALPTEWAAHATLSDAPVTLDPATVAAGRDAWIEAWTTQFEQQ